MRGLLLLLALAGCQRDNVLYCDEMVPCASGVCNLVTKQCETADAGVMNDFTMGPIDLSGFDFTGADLTQVCGACSGVTPICQNNACVGCGAAGGDSACLALSPTTPHCLASGACAQCRDKNDCSDPSKAICDSTTHQCRGCILDGECASKVCDLTPGSATLGQCVTGVIYVDCANGNDANDGKTPATAVKKISVGIMKAVAAGYAVVHIAAVAGGACMAENLAVMDPITLVGDNGATIKPMGNNNPAIDVKGATVVLRNLTFAGGTGNSGEGIYCEMNSTLTVISSTVTANNQYGIYDGGCTLITIDRSRIGALPGGTNNLAGGIFLAGAFSVTNNFIAKNGNATVSSGGGVVIMSPATASPRDFNSNTVADNIGSGPGAGVSCPVTAPVVVLNSIFWNNTATALPYASNCPTSYCGDDVPTEPMQSNNVALSSSKQPGFKSATDYHIGATSPLRAMGATVGVSDHDYDGQPRPDSTTGKSDIGADEYYP